MSKGFLRGLFVTAVGLESLLPGCATTQQPAQQAPEKPFISIVGDLTPPQKPMGMGIRPDGTTFIGHLEVVKTQANPGDNALPQRIERVYDPTHDGSYHETNRNSGEMKYITK